MNLVWREQREGVWELLLDAPGESNHEMLMASVVGPPVRTICVIRWWPSVEDCDMELVEGFDGSMDSAKAYAAALVRVG
jgi:hypothetical protein